MADKPADLVISYCTHHSEVIEKDYAKLHAALVEGYRVVDVICTPAGGAATVPSVTVTVILTHSKHSTAYNVKPVKPVRAGAG